MAATVSLVAPNTGWTGVSVKISGEAFPSENLVVRFGATDAVVVSVDITDPLACFAFVQVPAHAAGVVDIDLIFDDGVESVRVTGGFTYVEPNVITDIEPTTGWDGTTITITGSKNFPGAPTTVKVGGVNATNVTLSTPNVVTCSVPAIGAEGQVDVQLTFNDGSTLFQANAFTYVDPGALPINEGEIDAAFAAYIFTAPASVVQLELVEVYHPNFTKRYRVVRNAINGVTVTLEGTLGEAHFDYYPLRITPSGSRDNLDYSLKIELGDLGEVLPVELDAVEMTASFDVKPTVIYRLYRDDDLTKPVFGPIYLQVESFSFTKEGSTFEAKAPTINVRKTGKFYTPDKYPMLRGFL